MCNSLFRLVGRHYSVSACPLSRLYLHVLTRYAALRMGIPRRAPDLYRLLCPPPRPSIIFPLRAAGRP